VRSVMALLPLALVAALTGCDKQSDAAPQPGSGAESRDYSKDPAPDAPVEAEDSGKVDISKRGTAMPAIKFEGPKGEPVSLADFKGRPLLVNLWATWCGPCVAEMPTLDALAERQKDKLQVLVVSQDMQGREIVDPWWANRDYKMLKPYLDAKSDLGFAYGTGMVPTTVMYDKDGKEVWRVIGSMNWDGPRANTLMAEVIG
jgi:thiol-disulfide isomerase/thioredoxin